MNLDLFEEVDEQKAIQEFALKANWIKTSPNEIFLEQYNQTLKLENPTRETKKGFIRPSSLTECIRKMVFEYLAMPEESAYDGTPRIGESGTDAHTRIQNYIIAMKEHGYDVEYISVKDFLTKYPRENLTIIQEDEGHVIEKVDLVNNVIEYSAPNKDGVMKKYTKSLTWYIERYKGPETLVYNSETKSRFKADGIIKFNGEYYVLEIKTENSKKYVSHNKTFEPHAKHKLQGTFYGMSFGIDKVMFLYENRDSCATFMTVFEIDEAIRNKVSKIISETLRYGENEWVAPRTVSKEECRYCPYQNRCNQLGDVMPR